MMGGTESGEIRKIVWKGAVDIWKHYPIFGTGVETFAYSYYWYRPREHNDVSEWDFLYNKAHNEYLNYMATTGTVGLLAYLGMIGTFLGWSIRKLGWEVRCESGSRNEKWEKKKTKHSPSLPTSRPTSHFTLLISFLAGFASILVTNFFGFSVVPVNLLFFLFPAMSFVLSSSSPGVGRVSPLRCNRTYTSGIGIWQWLALAIIIFSLLTTHLSLLKYWYADTRFALGEKLNNSGQSTKALAELQKAIKARPFEPIYHDELGMVAASLAVAAFQQNQSTTAAQLSEFAISQSDQALKISPYNLNFWKNRTRIFYQLSEIEERYNQEALTSLLYAAQLAPTDAKIQYNLGLLYAKVGQEETAVKTLEKTVELKPNYDHARYALALFYEQKGDRQKAEEQLKYIIEKINPNYELAGEKLKELEKNP
jgi:Flp pilus assembly protein TadD